MVEKKFILNADDFGLSQAHNQAVLEGYINGFLSSASLCANGAAYDNAVHDILPDCPNLGIAAHLNIMEGRPLTHCPMLTNIDGKFNSSYLYLMANSKKEKLLSQIENEFRAQIEKILKDVKIDHLDSHVHTHAIPEIFKITCKLADEYGIKFVRPQFEELYFIPKIFKHLNFKYPPNLLKIALLQHYTRINRKVVKEYNLGTNDYIIGVGYTGMMDSDAVEYGLEGFDRDCIVEALIHPCKYSDSTVNQHCVEFEITKNLQLKDSIIRLGFDITNYKSLSV